jgi:protein-tyrosine phosphatase
MTNTLNNSENKHNKLIREQRGYTPKDLLPSLKKYCSFPVPDNFDPDEISWVLPRLGVTNLTGAYAAKDNGNFLINTAEEIHSPADLKQIVDHYDGPESVKKNLDIIATVIDQVLSQTDQNVVVHCYMGMERSVLSIVWYLHTFQGFTIDEAYQKVGEVRPIAIDHRSWVLGESVN